MFIMLAICAGMPKIAEPITPFTTASVKSKRVIARTGFGASDIGGCYGPVRGPQAIAA